MPVELRPVWLDDLTLDRAAERRRMAGAHPRLLDPPAPGTRLRVRGELIAAAFTHTLTREPELRPIAGQVSRLCAQGEVAVHVMACHVRQATFTGGRRVQVLAPEDQVELTLDEIQEFCWVQVNAGELGLRALPAAARLGEPVGYLA